MTADGRPIIHTLPDGYRQAYHLDITNPEHARPLNTLGLAAIPIFFIAGRGWLEAVRAVRGDFSVDLPLPGFVLVILSAVGVIILHEWIHGLFIRRTGHTPRYGIVTARAGRVTVPLAFYATADDAYFYRRDFIIIALAPAVLITGIGALLMVFLPDTINYYILLAIVINGSGAAGDFWMAYALRRYDEDNTLVRDEAHRMSIFVRDDAPDEPSAESSIGG